MAGISFRIHLEVLAASGIQTLEVVVLGEKLGLNLGSSLHVQNLEHHGLILGLGTILQGSYHALLILLLECLELVNVVVNRLCLDRCSHELKELLD